MAETASTQSALDRLESRLKELWDKSVDLFKHDLEGSRRSCVHRHCQRIWTQLEPSERDAIRKQVASESSPYRVDTPQSVADLYCTDAIEKRLRGTGTITL